MNSEIYKYITPESRWGHLNKPLHYTGEISQLQLFKKLKPFDQMALMEIIGITNLEAVKRQMNVVMLIVGSMANLSHSPRKDSDVDLLICFQKPELRSDTALELQERFIRSDDYLVDIQRPRGSALVGLNRLSTQTKIYLTPFFGNLTDDRSFFDITFLSENAGPVEFELNFHQKNNLAFSAVSP